MDELDRALKRLDEMISVHEASILSGAADDYAEYRYLVGVRAGLLKARGELVDMRDSEDEV